MLQCMLGTSIVQNSSMAPSKHCCMISFYLFIFLMVTIVEVHKLILDVCVSLSATIDENFLWTNCLESPLHYLTVTELQALRITFTVINTTSI